MCRLLLINPECCITSKRCFNKVLYELRGVHTYAIVTPEPLLAAQVFKIA